MDQTDQNFLWVGKIKAAYFNHGLGLISDIESDEDFEGKHVLLEWYSLLGLRQGYNDKAFSADMTFADSFVVGGTSNVERQVDFVGRQKMAILLLFPDIHQVNENKKGINFHVDPANLLIPCRTQFQK
eukprot:8686887-Ditylum_brightwellii.AAC.1